MLNELTGSPTSRPAARQELKADMFNAEMPGTAATPNVFLFNHYTTKDRSLIDLVVRLRQHSFPDWRFGHCNPTLFARSFANVLPTFSPNELTSSYDHPFKALLQESQLLRML